MRTDKRASFPAGLAVLVGLPRALANDLHSLVLLLRSRKNFITPPRRDILIFDRVCEPRLRETVLEGLPYETVSARFEEVNLSPPVALRFAANYLLHRLKSLFKTYFKPQGRGGFVYNMYLLAYAQTVKPKIVITTIEDSPDFHALARLYRRAKFIAVQNGLKFASIASVFQPFTPDGPQDKNVDLYCFGRREADLFGGAAPYVSFLPSGSLLAGFFKYEVQKEPLPERYDICLASIRKDGAVSSMDGKLRYVAEGLSAHEGFLKRYLKERGKSATLCIACRALDERFKAKEKERYLSLFFDAPHVTLTFIDFDQSTYSVYRAMTQSRIVTALSSTSAIEALGWGKKTLFCLFHAPEERKNLPDGEWRIYEPDYAAFKRAMDGLFSQDDEAFRSTNRDAMRYMMRDDPEHPVHRSVRRAAIEALRD